MNMPLLIVAACAGLPGCATGQAVPEPRSAATPPTPCAAQADSMRASSALPARAGIRPELQLGSVAAAGRVPSHASTPSGRAMAAATAAADNAHVEKNTQDSCASAATSGAPANGKATSDDA
jgi:hypothetical protein